MDVVSDMLRLLKLRASVYFHSQFCGSWAIDGGNEYRATFHLIARGNCWLHLTGQDRSIALTGGDLVVFPRDTPHTIGGNPQPPAVIDSPPVPAASDEEPTVSLVCGYFDFDSPQTNPVLDAMPDVVHIRQEDPARTTAMDTLLQNIAAETGSDAPGSDAVVDKLSEILFIYVVRAFMVQTDTRTGLLAALADRQLGPVMNAIHENPGGAWSVDKLAVVAGMSRSAFAKRFQEVTAMTPMQYVTRWRMQIAYELLRTSKDSVTRIAELSGYSAEASFRKAFKQYAGVGPGAVRKKQESDPGYD
ncbi:MAG: AraC family transcriptional regulator [Halobacteria archaeon]|nr:AraC family transcriptional regulator [Halobacteria archaeon]